MPKYSLTDNGNVIQCKWNCNLNHEHFIGSYELAVKYFGIDENQIKSYGNLMNIIIYHQSGLYTYPKLSNELFNILINAMSEHKYWIEPKYRNEKALEILSQAKKCNYIMDEKICKTIKQNKDNLKAQKRLFFYKKWIKENIF